MISDEVLIWFLLPPSLVIGWWYLFRLKEKDRRPYARYNASWYNRYLDFNEKALRVAWWLLLVLAVGSALAAVFKLDG